MALPLVARCMHASAFYFCGPLNPSYVSESIFVVERVVDSMTLRGISNIDTR